MQYMMTVLFLLLSVVSSSDVPQQQKCHWKSFCRLFILLWPSFYSNHIKSNWTKWLFMSQIQVDSFWCNSHKMPTNVWLLLSGEGHSDVMMCVYQTKVKKGGFFHLFMSCLHVMFPKGEETITCNRVIDLLICSIISHHIFEEYVTLEMINRHTLHTHSYTSITSDVTSAPLHHQGSQCFNR